MFSNADSITDNTTPKALIKSENEPQPDPPKKRNKPNAGTPSKLSDIHFSKQRLTFDDDL